MERFGKFSFYLMMTALGLYLLIACIGKMMNTVTIANHKYECKEQIDGQG